MKSSDVLRGTALVVSFVLLYAPACGSGPRVSKDLKPFGGSFQTGIYFKLGDVYAMAPMFMDETRPAVIKAADDKLSDGVVEAICKNGDRLKLAPAMGRAMDKQLGHSTAEALHIAVFPHSGIKLSEELKGAATFDPGPVTTLAEVVKRFGNPVEREPWIAKEFQSWLGLNGTVHWWGAVGIACSSSGNITHVLFREKDSWRF